MEAAFLIPWTVLLTALLLVMVFYFGNTVHYKTAAFEAALAGNQYIAGAAGSGRAGRLESSSDQNTAGAKEANRSARARIADQALPGTEPEVQVSCTNGGTEVCFSGQKYTAFSDYFSWSVKETVKHIHPSGIVRAKWILSSYTSEEQK